MVTMVVMLMWWLGWRFALALSVKFCELGTIQKFSTDSRQARDKWLDMCIENNICNPTIPVNHLELDKYDVCVDGMLGTGIKGAVRTPIHRLSLN